MDKKTKIKLAIALSVLSIIVAVTVVSITVSANSSKTDKKPEEIVNPPKKPYDLSKLSENEKSRIDCFLEAQSKFENLTKYQCEIRSCIYKPSEYDRVPDCYFDREKLGYKLTNTITDNKMELYKLTRDKTINSIYQRAIDELDLTVEYLGENMVHVKITDAKDKKRYEVPYELNKPETLVDKSKSKAQFKLEQTDNGLIYFKIVRKSNNEVLFDTSFGGFVYTDQFLQIATKINSPYIYGFGENNHESLKHDLNYRSWGMFARDHAPGWGDNLNNYGFQPVYLSMEQSSAKSHLVLLYNSNAMEYLFTPAPSLVLRTIGGVLDFYFVVDENTEQVLQSYHQLIGKPIFPPYWSLGFQLSRWGYENLQDVKNTVKRNADIKLFQDVQYLDIEYMIGNRILTIDQEHFKGLREFIEQLKSQGIRNVLIVDPGLVIERNNSHYMRGVDDDIYIKWPKYYEPYDRDSINPGDVISWCWPNGKISYPDYMNEKTHEWWFNTISNFINNVTGGCDMAGMWIDMNEPSSFETNELKPWNWLYPDNDQDRYPYFSLKCPTNRFDDPPYRTKNAFAYDGDHLLAKKARLSQKTVCMISEHQFNNNKYIHYDVHSLYGHSQSIATYKAFNRLNKGRPFVLTRSNFVGTGHYAAHWLGDNDATWKHMKMSIIGIIEYNIFGFPMIGADICGFFISVQDAEMCTRWLQLGAFYTFSRNHNANKQLPKDPASFNNSLLAESTVNVLRIRYTILPYIYNELFRVSSKGGSATKALFFEFSDDIETYNIDKQFLLGPALLVSPVLDPNVRSVQAYFPNATWFDYRTGKRIEARKKYLNLEAPLDYINLHVRGGFVMPTRDPKDCRNIDCINRENNPFSLLITLDENKEAKGELYWDDGFEKMEKAKYFHAAFTFKNNKLNASVVKNTIEDSNKLYMNSMKFYGITDKITKIFLNGKEVTDYSQKENVLEIRNADIKFNQLNALNLEIFF